MTDTAQTPVQLTAIVTSDTTFVAIAQTALPLTLQRGEVLHVTFKRAGAGSNDSFTVRFLQGDATIRIDTFVVRTLHPALRVHTIVQPLDTVSLASTGVVLLASDLRGIAIDTLVIDLASMLSDIGEIDLGSIVVNPNLTAGFTSVSDSIGVRCVLVKPHVNSWDPNDPAANWVIRFNLRGFVSSSGDTAIVITSARAPSFAGCLANTIDTALVPIPAKCTDPFLRNKLAERPLITDVSIAPNPATGNVATLALNANEAVILHVQLIDATGMIRSSEVIEGVRGNFNYAVDLKNCPSGGYTLRVDATSSDGTAQHISRNLSRPR